MTVRHICSFLFFLLSSLAVNGHAAENKNFLGVRGGYAFGVEIFGSHRFHNFVRAEGYWGTNISKDKATFDAHSEFLIEVLAGIQTNPDNKYLFAVSPVYRYVFNQSEKLQFFTDISIGIAATNILQPALGSVFQFLDQGGFGSYVWISKTQRITLLLRFMHISNANLVKPNIGTNSVLSSIGYSWKY